MCNRVQMLSIPVKKLSNLCNPSGIPHGRHERHAGFAELFLLKRRLTQINADNFIFFEYPQTSHVGAYRIRPNASTYPCGCLQAYAIRPYSQLGKMRIFILFFYPRKSALICVSSRPNVTRARTRYADYPLSTASAFHCSIGML